MGHGPGAAAGGDFPADIEIRYCLGRGDSGVYTYCTFEHQPDYPAASMTEARYCAKLADMFDWMTLDAKRSQHFPARPPRRRQIHLHRRPIRAPRLRLVEHDQERRLLAHQPERTST